MRAHQGVCKSRDSATNGFIFQQTMFRIKDPKRTLDFYTRVMGMTCVGSALKCVLSSPCAQPQPVYQAGFNTAPARRAEAPSALGRLLTKLDFEPMEFSLLFLGMVDPASVPEDPKDRVRAPRPPHHRPRPCSRARHAWKHGGVLSAHPMLQVGCCTSVTANMALSLELSTCWLCCELMDVHVVVPPAGIPFPESTALTAAACAGGMDVWANGCP